MSGFRGEDVEVNKSLVSERDQCPEGALTPNLNVEDPVKKTTLLQKILRTNFKYENQQRAITPKV